MAITVTAVYQDGVLKPAEPLPFKENEKVCITVQTAVERIRASYGLLGWKGSAELAERFAMDVELEYPPPSEER